MTMETGGPLDDGGITPRTDPFVLFQEWLKEAEGAEPNDPNAMALATADAQGVPDVRMVLLKGVQGAAAPVSDAEADAYFATRPKDSQIGAWASPQSRPMEGRFVFEKAIAEYAIKYALTKVPRPPYWTGWRITPLRIEFWRDRPFRLHDRLVYARPAADAPWRTERLFP